MAGSDAWKMFVWTFEGFEKHLTFCEIVTFRADRRNVCLCMQMTNGYMENVRMSIEKNVDFSKSLIVNK